MKLLSGKMYRGYRKNYNSWKNVINPSWLNFHDVDWERAREVDRQNQETARNTKPDPELSREIEELVKEMRPQFEDLIKKIPKTWEELHQQQ